MFKKFRSPDEDIRVANILGFTAIIGKEFVSVHQSLWKMAYSEGAISEDVLAVAMEYVQERKLELNKKDIDERVRIKSLMKDAILEEPTKYLDKSNDIIYRNIVILTKKPYKKSYYEEIWKEIANEAN